MIDEEERERRYGRDEREEIALAWARQDRLDDHTPAADLVHTHRSLAELVEDGEREARVAAALLGGSS